MKNILFLMMVFSIFGAMYHKAYSQSNGKQMIDSLIGELMKKTENEVQWREGIAFEFLDETDNRIVAKGVVLECVFNNVRVKFTKQRSSLLAVARLQDLRTGYWVEDIEGDGTLEDYNYPSRSIAERMYKMLLKRALDTKKNLKDLQDTTFFNKLKRYDEASSIDDANRYLEVVFKSATRPELQMIAYSRLIALLDRNKASENEKIEYKREYLKWMLDSANTFYECYWVFDEAYLLGIKSLEKDALSRMSKVKATPSEKAELKEARKLFKGRSIRM